MASEAVTQIAPPPTRESSVGGESMLSLAQSGDLRGWSFPKRDDQGLTGMFRIPTGTLTTGLTFQFVVVDDGTNANDLGKVARFGVTLKRMIDGETTDLDTAAGAEQAKDVTLDATTTGAIDVSTLAIANANLDGAAVGESVAYRIRRIGSHANDTLQGRVILLSCTPLAT